MKTKEEISPRLSRALQSDNDDDHTESYIDIAETAFAQGRFDVCD
jgi:hypothetical protein